MNIVEQQSGDELILRFEGKIDKITSAQAQSSILSAVQKNANLTLDFMDVPYISSAGLRALLLGQKSANAKGGSMKVINVGPEVMSVLKLSGFDKVLTIQVV